MSEYNPSLPTVKLPPISEFKILKRVVPKPQYQLFLFSFLFLIFFFSAFTYFRLSRNIPIEDISNPDTVQEFNQAKNMSLILMIICGFVVASYSYMLVKGLGTN